MAEQIGSYIVCDKRDLLKIDEIYYLPQNNDWIKRPFYCQEETDYKRVAIRVTSILDRHSGLTAEQVKMA